MLFSDYQRADLALKSFRRGAKLNDINAKFAVREIISVPNVLLPVNKLRDYISSSLVVGLLDKRIGYVSDPIKVNDQYQWVVVINKYTSKEPKFEEIREAVLAEFFRRQDETALIEYISKVKEASSISYAELD